jgi:oligopeptide transport system ATP-binding protein
MSSSVFGPRTGWVRAVDDVSFTVEKAETFSLVGESGSGKTTVGRVMLNLIPPTAGETLLDGVNIYDISARSMNDSRKRLQIIFQDPYASLNPRMTVEQIISEGMLLHGMENRRERREHSRELLRTVGLRDEHINRYPHEFSGGQRQRIGIARAISLNPEFIVCDEPVSALDVSIQAQIINLLMDLQEQFGISYLFISHDLSVVKHISKRIGVMYSGRIVESADKNELFTNPLHPYTQELLSAIPSLDITRPAKRHRQIESGTAKKGCAYCDRCPCRMVECAEQEPTLVKISDSHLVSCFAVKK